MVKNNRYIIATQDRELQEWMRRQPGKALMYLHKITPVLEPPSDRSKKFADKKMTEQVSVNTNENEKIKYFKSKEGIVEEEKIAKKKKKIKNPNPLSCKKKKKKSTDNQNQSKNRDGCDGSGGVKDGRVEKVKKGKKIKMSRHLRQHMKVLKMKLNENS